MINWEFLGRLHPLILHLPIGLIFGLCLIEGLSLIIDRGARAWQVCRRAYMMLLSLSCMAAAATGYILSLEGQNDGMILTRHKWFGLAVAGLSVLLFLLAASRSFQLKGFGKSGLRFLVVLCLFSAIVVTGHLGGQLTHGPHFLSTHAPPALQAFLGPAPQDPEPKSPASATAYAALIEPILENHCVFCHGSDRQQSQLAVHTQDALMAGGRAGPAIIAGVPQDSELIKRIQLPLAEVGHMPPEGKSQLSSLQISALQWWVTKGASYDTSLDKNELPQALAGLLPQTVPTVEPSDATAVQTQWDETLIRRLMDQQISIQRIQQDDQRLWVSFPAIADQVTDDTVKQLVPLSPFIVWLDLSNTHITSASLPWIAKMPALAELNLSQTGVEAQALDALAQHKSIEQMNLSGLPLDDTVVDMLLGMPNLKRVTLWGSQVSKAGMRQLTAPRIEAISGVTPSAVISTQPNEPTTPIEPNKP
jgi:mono/diheme cytochrome c family protein